ncbi:hypothetical protein ACFYUD_26380 [Nocardia tengchongensis]|uniref:hypothetical protein n=1 Tax=Nocardia tengchongensis TaxID=2055889 RepID=UPI003623FB4B
MLTKALAAAAISAAVLAGAAPAEAAPAPEAVADTGSQTGSATGSAKAALAWPLGFVIFSACFADGDSKVHNSLCQALLDLTAGSTNIIYN